MDGLSELRQPSTHMMTQAGGSSSKVSKPMDGPLRHGPSGEGHSYGQILKSSALIGGPTGLNLLIGVFRTKAMALLLGPPESAFLDYTGRSST